MSSAALSRDIVSPAFDVERFLDAEREKDLFRFSTAGSVDDGKSTLIGRLLYDTQSIYEDQVKSIQGKGTTAPGQIDFALLTDGLRAEREQGITIDVAYRYFSTGRRKFIIADTPGHEQYTRNMATGASTADAAVVLIDARKGVLPQSLRHAYIASLLGVRHILVAVNKMDLVNFDQAVFQTIQDDFSDRLSRIGADTGRPVHSLFVPISALTGDNVVHRSIAAGWYDGPSLLELLEALPAAIETGGAPFRFPVQRVVRPDQSFRGFAGQIAAGTVRVGDDVTVLPSGGRAQVTRIVTYDRDLDHAAAPLSVTLTLSHEVDISRGDLIVPTGSQASVCLGCESALVWMDRQPLDPDRRYLLKHASQTVPAFVAIQHRTDVGTLAREFVNHLALNEIGTATIRFLRPVALDRYSENRTTGAFVLVDPQTNSTVAAGMISEPLTQRPFGQHHADADVKTPSGPVGAAERARRWGHSGGVLTLAGPAAIIDRIERALFVTGIVTVRAERAHQAEWLAGNGVLALLAAPSDSGMIVARVSGLESSASETDTAGAIAATIQLLKRAGVLLEQRKPETL